MNRHTDPCDSRDAHTTMAAHGAEHARALRIHSAVRPYRTVVELAEVADALAARALRRCVRGHGLRLQFASRGRAAVTHTTDRWCADALAGSARGLGADEHATGRRPMAGSERALPDDDKIEPAALIKSPLYLIMGRHVTNHLGHRYSSLRPHRSRRLGGERSPHVSRDGRAVE